MNKGTMKQVLNPQKGVSGPQNLETSLFEILENRGQTDRQTDRQIDRQTDRQTGPPPKTRNPATGCKPIAGTSNNY